MSRTEATLSWDASGYYMYLPAVFIYGDLKGCSFANDILSEYGPTPDFQQAYKHSSGNYVMKYSCGQAIQYFPAFAAGHAYAMNSSYKADGFSRPYQLAVAIWSFLIAFCGLFFLRKALLKFFNDNIVAVTLIAIVLGSNYLDYAGINGAMTHNSLFTLYSALIYITITYYRNPKTTTAILIGGIIGLASLTRPTEIISILIPIFWGVTSLSKNQFFLRTNHFIRHKSHLIWVIIPIILIGSIQLAYWKYATGEWIVYSYQDQGFSWLRPHILDGIFSYKSGWLIYSPIMAFSIVGFYYALREKQSFFVATILFSSLFIYIAFAWDIWWYGGSLGQRTMVQAYPVLAFPLAAFAGFVLKRKWTTTLFALISLLFISYNLWLTHHAHRGGILHVGQMTKAYFWKTLGKNNVDQEDLKLLDTNEYYEGNRNDVEVVFLQDFESDTTYHNCSLPPISGKKSMCLNDERQFSSAFNIDIESSDKDWLRATVTVLPVDKEWDNWRMTQFVVKFFNFEKEIKSRMIRLHRHLQSGQKKIIFFDTKIPEKSFNKISVYFWNADSNKEILLDDLKIELYNE